MLNANSKFAVVGLGQVGLPLAVALARHYPTIGIDLDRDRLHHVRTSHDPAGLMELRDDFSSIAACDFVVVTVPSRAGVAQDWAGSALASGCALIARQLRPGTTIIFESTLQPGTTEELCVPLLERESGLRWKRDFFVAYSPERINPGDPQHTLETIPKLVAADTEQTLQRVATVYAAIVPAGVHRMSSIRAAELTKVLENAQRDLNIALMNELSTMSSRLGLDTAEILEAASTKWNFAPYRPGLVGGACLSLACELWEDTRRALELPTGVVNHGRRINDGMVNFVVDELVRLLAVGGVAPEAAHVLQVGAAFKPNVPTLAESKNLELAKEMGARGMRVWLHDPLAPLLELRGDQNLEPCSDPDSLPVPCDAVIWAVAHDQLRARPLEQVLGSLRPSGLVLDLTHTLDPVRVRELGHTFWRL